MADSDQLKWYRQTRGVVLLLVLFFPVGLYLMWKYTEWGDRPKWVITGGFGFALLIGIVTPSPETTELEPGNQVVQAGTSAAQTETTQPEPEEDSEPVPEPSTTTSSTTTSTTASTTTTTTLPKPKGLGVSRAALMDIFASDAIGFTFESSPLGTGEDRYMGQSPSGLATMEFTGPANDLTKVYIIAALPSDDPEAAALNGVLMSGLLVNTLPLWLDGVDWFTDAVDRIADEGTITTTHDGKKIELKLIEALGFLSLSISSE